MNVCVRKRNVWKIKMNSMDDGPTDRHSLHASSYSSLLNLLAVFAGEQLFFQRTALLSVFILLANLAAPIFFRTRLLYFLITYSWLLCSAGKLTQFFSHTYEHSTLISLLIKSVVSLSALWQLRVFLVLIHGFSPCPICSCAHGIYCMLCAYLIELLLIISLDFR